MSTLLDSVAVVGGIVAAMGGLLAVLLQMYRLKRLSLYEVNLHKMELGAMRESLERQISALTDRLMASESRWQEVNHLLISSQARQPDTVPAVRRLPMTSLMRAVGITADDMKIDQNLVFVLTPFHSDSAEVFGIIVEVCRELGLRALRGDEEFVAGDVFSHILKLIVRARIIVANIQERNPNVYYELGLAHALDKTTILVARQPEDVPFDVRAKKLVLFHAVSELRDKLQLELARSLAQ